MSDQAQQAGSDEASVSPEVADYFGVTPPASETSTEKVTSSGEENKKADADKTKENTSEKETGEAEKPTPTEEKKTTEAEDKKDSAAKPDEEKAEKDTSKTFEVAGVKYDKYEDAVKAVNRISGENSRLAGDKKTLEQKASAAEEKLTSLSQLLEDYKKANEEWQKYYEEGGEKPDNTKVNLEAEIDKALEIREKRKAEISAKQQFSAEIDAIVQEPDWKDVKPFFEELVNEYEGVPKVAPKKLYDRARLAFKAAQPNSNLKDADDIQKLIDEGVKKGLAKREISKAPAASGGSANKEKEEENVSPEVADYFKSR